MNTAATLLVLTLCAASAERGRVIYNLDASEFFVGTFGKPVPETIDKFVAEHASLGISDFFICVNMQRTNYRSAVWEADWDGYDPAAGDDQPFFAGLEPGRQFEAQWTKNAFELHKQGCDYPRRMLQAARRGGMKAWLSVRMNDSHYPGQPRHPYHSRFWREHAAWHLPNRGLDFEHAEVRNHYVKLIEELCSRYDCDGVELDFLRFPQYFRPGRAQAGVPLMTELVETARKATTRAAQRLGHDVRLAVRVPISPHIARGHGLDAAVWAKQGLVDLIVAAPWWASACSDMPVESWKEALAGTKTALTLSLEDGIQSGATARRTMHPEEMRGVLLSAWHRGVDGVYFFNLFTGPYSWPRSRYESLVKDAGLRAALEAGPRRHPLTITEPWSVGQPGRRAYLPADAAQASFRLHIGPRPGKKQKAFVELTLPRSEEPVDVLVNGKQCTWLQRADAEHLKSAGVKGPLEKRHIYAVPTDALVDGYNVVETRAKGNTTITWIEIAVR